MKFEEELLNAYQEIVRDFELGVMNGEDSRRYANEVISTIGSFIHSYCEIDRAKVVRSIDLGVLQARIEFKNMQRKEEQ